MMAHESGRRERKGQLLAALSRLPDPISQQQHWEEENVGDAPIHQAAQEVSFMTVGHLLFMPF